jgi:hypothetical protein
MAAYVQASCRCRTGFVRPFCWRWFPTLPRLSHTRCCDCGAALHRPESIKAARCFEYRLLCNEPTNRRGTHDPTSCDIPASRVSRSAVPYSDVSALQA